MRKNAIKYLTLVLIVTVMLLGCGNAETNASDLSEVVVSQSSDSESVEKDTKEQPGEKSEEIPEENESASESSQVAERSENAEESTAESEEEQKEQIVVKEVSYEKYCTQALNVRDYPDKSGNKLHTFGLNSKVSVIGECDNGWVQIKFDDGVAYVHGRYLSDEETIIKEEVPESVQTAAIVEGDYNLEVAKQVFAMVNEIRAENGVAELTWDDRLYESAKIRAQEAGVYWSHTRPDGSSCFTVSDVVHGENLAKGYPTPETVVEGWMNSQGHKDNILNASFTRTGIAYYNTDKGALWCHHFGY